MRPDAALLKADIQDEISKLQRVVDEFRPFLPKLELSDHEVVSYDKMVVGYLLHSFYNGCENIFRSVARFFENEVTPDSWHRDLLQRMKLDVGGYRPRLISEDVYRLLDDFRGFRHRFRHSYSFELDWEREKVVARKLERTWKLFQQDVEEFVRALELLPEDHSK